MRVIRTISLLLFIAAFSACNATHAGESNDNSVTPSGTTTDVWKIDENKVLDNASTAETGDDWTDELIDLVIELFLLG